MFKYYKIKYFCQYYIFYYTLAWTQIELINLVLCCIVFNMLVTSSVLVFNEASKPGKPCFKKTFKIREDC